MWCRRSHFDPLPTLVLFSAGQILICRSPTVDFAIEVESAKARQVIGYVEPTYPIRIEHMVGRNEGIGVVKCADVELENLAALREVALNPTTLDEIAISRAAVIPEDVRDLMGGTRHMKRRKILASDVLFMCGAFQLKDAASGAARVVPLLLNCVYLD